MKLNGSRTVRAAIGIGLIISVLRAADAVLDAYIRHKGAAIASVVSLKQNLALVGQPNPVQPASGLGLGHGDQAEALNGKSRTAAIAELAGLMASAIERDSVGNLVFTPERDTTAVGRLRRVAMKLRFETDTEGLFDALSSLLKATSLVRIDGIRVVASTTQDGRRPVPLSVDARVSAWFLEGMP